MVRSGAGIAFTVARTGGRGGDALRDPADASAAGWLAERLHPFGRDVGSVIPPGFDWYARIFHPASRRTPQGDRDVGWKEIARANSRVFHTEAQLSGLTGLSVASGSTPLWDQPPRTGSLPRHLAARIADVFARCSGEERCWFAVWDGWGRLTPPATPKFELPGRGYYLAEGPLAMSPESMTGEPWFQSASIWWPESRAWCVATEVDFMWTYVGGSSDCIAAVLEHHGIEALPASLTDRFTFDSDRVNPPPTR
jgi:hypothetical protein